MTGNAWDAWLALVFVLIGLCFLIIPRLMRAPRPIGKDLPPDENEEEGP